ncbi:tryptophan 7-halogenase [Stenoxybacter acetivorans]|uniref:tryptophan 7-halogenase n=1 Tax=Stenoxybacter acetivorans TaxID=422441 RepID=UPI00056A1F6D|nr:tryptophan 7-halogenase [Stenoxybacter acetivorans]
MLDLREAKNIVIIGGGTAGWFAALVLRRMFPPQTAIKVIESPDIGIVGVGEGGLINIVNALNSLNIPTSEFMQETGASLKWGFCYEGWRTGEKNDEYYHLFIDPRQAPFNDQYAGFLPKISGLFVRGIPLHQAVNGFPAIKQRVSQQEAAEMLVNGNTGITTSFHFDSYRTAKFLQKKAIERGVLHRQTEVIDILMDAHQNAAKIMTDEGAYRADFLIDASGLSRVVIDKKLKRQWTSFKDYLWLDRAIPFYVPHQGKNPELFTRATAMKAGWIWQIPLVERIGAGYVYCSKYLSEEAALKEISDYFQMEIEPQKTLNFEPGHYAEVWKGNIMALGLSSGFVEPLEATSIGQMLEQLFAFERVVTHSGWVVSDLSIDQFNEANKWCWNGIRDFLRMHYDCPRRDTPFWQEVSTTPYPDTYRAVKEVFAQRSPRMEDIKGYATGGWGGIFHAVNWMFVAQPLGLISEKGCRQELKYLPAEKIQEITQYIDALPNV